MNTSDTFYPNGRTHSRPLMCNRREFLTRTGGGLGMLGLAGMLDQAGLLAGEPATPGGIINPLASKAPHFAPKAKSVIWCFMYGGPSSVDLFDHKPELDRSHGKKIDTGKTMFFGGEPGPLMKSPFSFKKHGQSGAWVSDALPNIAECVDDIAFIRSCHIETNVHDQALFQVNTGLTRLGFPCAGSWTTYGLGSENQNLPGFVVMHDPRGMPVGGPPLWSSGFLPNSHQGTVFRAGKSPILNLARPEGLSDAAQRRQLDFLGDLNASHQSQHPGEPELLARIASFELAYRMQMTAPEAVDITSETKETRALYGIDRPVSQTYGTQLLMARRMVEKGVRFVQVYSGGINSEWDSHEKVAVNHKLRCDETDQPVAGLLKDLKRRGLLDSTLVIWGGEFGRLPMSQGNGGRDHNPKGFMMWMAGGGIKGGASLGETDEIGYKAAVDPVSIHDIHATVLHCLGMDHKRLTYFHNGRNFRLTDVAGEILRPILA